MYRSVYMQTAAMTTVMLHVLSSLRYFNKDKTIQVPVSYVMWQLRELANSARSNKCSPFLPSPTSTSTQ